MAKAIVIIPARYESTRLPGKPLLDIGGKTLINRVYEQVLKSKEADRVIIATDDQRIEDHCRQFGAEVEMTFRSHNSGTDRCAQVAEQFWTDEIIINVQGDEPFIDPDLIDEMIITMRNDDWKVICSYMNELTDHVMAEDVSNVKVVVDKNEKALYFSRFPIPYLKNLENFSESWLKHTGIYGFRNAILQELTALEPSHLEIREGLEQLRWLENGYKIHMLRTEHEALSIDTQADLELARKMLS